jgi:hypothetical protein
MPIVVAFIKIIAAVGSVFAVWYVKKALRPWLQKFQTAKDTASDSKDREDSTKLNQKQNAESDKLKGIDGR